MSRRAKRVEVVNLFMLLCADLGKKAVVLTSDLTSWKRAYSSLHTSEPCDLAPYPTVGAWMLDYNPYYGGWMVNEIENEDGGLSNPLGNRRFTARAFLDILHFSRAVLQHRGRS